MDNNAILHLAGWGFQARVLWVPGLSLGWDYTEMPWPFGGTLQNGYKCFLCFLLCLACVLSLWSLHVFLLVLAFKETPGWLCQHLDFGVGSQDGGTLSPDPKDSTYFPSSSYTTSLNLKK